MKPENQGNACVLPLRGLVEVSGQEETGFIPDRQAYDQGRAAALKALRLDPALAEAYTSLAYEKFVNEHDWAGADENYQRAIATDPGLNPLRSDPRFARIRQQLRLNP